MPKKADVNNLRRKTEVELSEVVARYKKFNELQSLTVEDNRWVVCMILVNLQSIWERFAEKRLVSVINHSPDHFLLENNVRGIKKIPVGLAFALIRKGGKYFDFRSYNELIEISKRMVGVDANPFPILKGSLDEYLDTIAIVRNYIVHKSDSSFTSYKRRMKEKYLMSYPSGPGEFLLSIDYKDNSIKKNEPRINGFFEAVKQAITQI
ncbi:hypothetical protein EHO59_10950 [Leptospira semungkisensis]|uniref:RiboL-PSP-HEPN domain-containing protein n=1 Tax=Leptospira semungkisensis TaxID=2484985 RepID=A0A4R9FY98_9LEPT|nr:hypothetical protein [Leptospira semungkisensis]TGK04026.1 hypothetical protein EHO59_10950 [Leptospira semungkisensis]